MRLTVRPSLIYKSQYIGCNYNQPLDLNGHHSIEEGSQSRLLAAPKDLLTFTQHTYSQCSANACPSFQTMQGMLNLTGAFTEVSSHNHTLPTLFGELWRNATSGPWHLHRYQLHPHHHSRSRRSISPAEKVRKRAIVLLANRNEGQYLNSQGHDILCDIFSGLLRRFSRNLVPPPGRRSMSYHCIPQHCAQTVIRFGILERRT